MATNIEIEAKVLITKEDYDKLVKIYSKEKTDEFAQVNYYIESKDLDLKKLGVGLRIRKKDNSYVMTLKAPMSEGLLEKNAQLNEDQYKEFKEKGIFPDCYIKEFIKMLGFDPDLLKIRAQLKTHRIEIPLDDGKNTFSIDKNEYNKITDFELEMNSNSLLRAKNKLQEMREQGYHIFSVLMRLYERDVENPDAPTVEGEDRHMTYGELAEEIFGTATNPTSEYFYFIDYEDLSTTVNDDIFNNITTVKDNTLKNIVIKDYFPQEIVDNFDFEYVTEPNIGTISETIDTSDNSITWNIPQLAEGEVATVSYKLKLKEQYDADIVDQILPTNTNVDIDFETADGSGNAHSDVSPKIRLTYEEVPQKDPDGNTDNTVANTDIPQTGNNTISILAIAVTAVILFALSRIVRIKNLNKTK